MVQKSFLLFPSLSWCQKTPVCPSFLLRSDPSVRVRVAGCGPRGPPVHGRTTGIGIVEDQGPPPSSTCVGTLPAPGPTRTTGPVVEVCLVRLGVRITPTRNPNDPRRPSKTHKQAESKGERPGTTTDFETRSRCRHSLRPSSDRHGVGYRRPDGPDTQSRPHRSGTDPRRDDPG